MNPVSRIAAGAAIVFSCLIGAPAVAYADESAAETLFQEGLAAMKKNDYAVACEAFAQSNKADPSPGTQINLALCYEKQKKWASAWTWYRSAVGLAQQRGQAEREKLADEAAARIRPNIHYIVVSVKEPLTDLSVKRDGIEVTIAIAGKEVPLPVDPGEHTIDVSARGKKPWSKTIHIAETAATERIDVPKLEDAPVEDKVAAGPGTEYRPPIIVTNDGSTQRTVGIVVAGAGILAGLAGAGVFVLAHNEADERDQKRAEAAKQTDVNEQARLNKGADSNNEAAQNNQLIAMILGGGAVVLVGVGAVLYFTAPKHTEKSAKASVLPLVGPSFAGLGLGGTF
ncbi:MAG TPA: hypothetical protein VM580_23500 [Labilithrix sp.]|nr:hypothetical protein [Labilithrix sp.]